MKICNMVVGAVGLALSGAVLAQGDMGSGMQGGMGPGMHNGMGVHGGMWGEGNAKITKDEFMKRAEARFARLDVNKDGVIDATDRAQLRQRMRECRELMGDMGMMGGHRSMMGHTPAPPAPKTKP